MKGIGRESRGGDHVINMFMKSVVGFPCIVCSE